MINCSKTTFTTTKFITLIYTHEKRNGKNRELSKIFSIKTECRTAKCIIAMLTYTCTRIGKPLFLHNIKLVGFFYLLTEQHLNGNRVCSLQLNVRFIPGVESCVPTEWNLRRERISMWNSKKLNTHLIRFTYRYSTIIALPQLSPSSSSTHSCILTRMMWIRSDFNGTQRKNGLQIG